MKHGNNGLHRMPPEMIDTILTGLKLGDAAIKALADIELGEPVTFQCPICGGTAHACRAKINGHLHVQCPECKNSLMQ